MGGDIPSGTVGDGVTNVAPESFLALRQSAGALPPLDRAAFAVTSRLISCIVNEGVLNTWYLALDETDAPFPGLCIVLCSEATGLSEDEKVFCVVALHHSPILEKENSQRSLRRVLLLDPLDMLPYIFTYNGSVNQLLAYKDVLFATSDPTHLFASSGAQPTLALNLKPIVYWDALSAILNIKPTSKKSIELELVSSWEWQAATYQDPPRPPTFQSSSIEWEQSLLEVGSLIVLEESESHSGRFIGHPTHPMNRARRATPPMANIQPGTYDFYRPSLRFVSVPRSSLILCGQFEELIKPLYDAAASVAGKPLPSIEPSRILIAVHELQLPHIELIVKDVEVLGEEYKVDAMAHASLRTLSFPHIPSIQGYAIKVALGMKVTSALRTISHWTGDFGPRFSEEVVPHLSINPEVLILEREIGSSVYIDEDPERAKHFTSVIREAYEDTSVERFGEKVIVCAALVERDGDGVAAVRRVFELEDREKRLDFARRYITLILEGVIPPLVVNGVAFEAHPQNVLARFDVGAKELKGFVIRDLGGLRIHGPTLVESIGKPFEFLPGHCIPTGTVKEASKKLYHTLFYNHLQRFLRVMDLHYGGEGWAWVREELGRLIPEKHLLRDAWLGEGSEVVDGKCLLRMKLDGLYRDHVYHKMPNLIHYRPETRQL